MELTRRGLIGRAVAAGGALVTAGLRGRSEIAFAGPDGEAVFDARVPRSASPRAASARSASARAASARSAFARAASARWTSGPIRAPRRFELIGVEVPDGRDPGIEIRARGRDGRWCPWLAAPLAHGHAPDAAAGPAPDAGGLNARRAKGGRRLTEPVWTGAANMYELRAKRPLPGARVVFVDGGRTPIAAASSRYVKTGLEAGPGQPRIISRAAWATRACRPRKSAAYGGVDLAVVHHTVNANFYTRGQSASMVRSICLFHKYGNGWNDIGYNFVVDRHGQVFEGREGGADEPLVGAHAGGYNVYSTGVALLGTHSGVGPTRTAFDALARLIAWKLSLHGVSPRGRTSVRVTRPEAPVTRYRPGTQVSLNRIAAHGDGNTTSCPGAGMRRQLPRLRQVASRLAGTPSSLTAEVTGAVPGGAIVAGHLSRAGFAIGGAIVEIQRRSDRGQVTVTSATTQADGIWTAQVPLARSAVLRAVFRGMAPSSAVVSSTVFAAVPPVVEVTAAVQQLAVNGVTEFSGRVTPVKRRLLMTITKQQPDGTFAVFRTIRFGASEDGTFARTIGFPEPGRYDVVVTVPADGRNAAGSSAPVPITVG